MEYRRFVLLMAFLQIKSVNFTCIFYIYLVKYRGLHWSILEYYVISVGGDECVNGFLTVKSVYDGS